MRIADTDPRFTGAEIVLRYQFSLLLVGDAPPNAQFGFQLVLDAQAIFGVWRRHARRWAVVGSAVVATTASVAAAKEAAAADANAQAAAAKELKDGWSEAFESNYPDVSSVKSEISELNAGMRDVKSAGSIVLDLWGDAVDVLISGKKTDSVNGTAFQRAVSSIWLGLPFTHKDH